ncbi:MAG TPA: 5'/3'-nucleotidase SurE [Verrucomicrobiales bacterium]|nr:5'/3'-nucleotidase SurE [Verrucomicrobiales bacterium]HRJ09860.1 5'/3'-nucleotidase SurE [Prosthecobacter sp.]HRK16106.1 5'/3'-nucleotidase SurE [Prosthecobacter sp.]
MDILITNDDGIDAPGLAALERAACGMGRVVVVAPMREQSMCGHRVTTRSPIRMEQRSQDRWAVDGTPADCVRLALRALDLRPAWVLSGVNAGGNMGQDIVISGTVAAAREAAYHGLRAMALSHYLIRDLAVDWLRVGEWAGELMRELSGAALADGEFWNVNLPHHPPGTLGLPERLPCHPARSPLNVSYAPTEHGHVYTASYAERPQDPGSDVEVCFSGRVAVSRLRIG